MVVTEGTEGGGVTRGQKRVKKKGETGGYAGRGR